MSLAEKYPPRRTPPGPLEMPEIERREPKQMNRGKRIKKENKPRLAKRRAATFAGCARLARLLPCCVCGRTPSQACHVRTRGAGGKDAGNVVPACATHHGQMSAPGWGIKTFQKRHGINLEVVASHLLDAVRDHACASWRRPNKKTRAPECAVCLASLEGLTP